MFLFGFTSQVLSLTAAVGGGGAVWAVVAVTVVLVCIAAFWHGLTVPRYEVESSKLKGGQFIRIVHISDLHSSRYGKGQEKLLRNIRELMPDRGEGVYLQGPIFFDFGYNISMGKGSFANFNFTVMDENRVTIGENVFIGPGCTLATAVHPLRWQERNSFFNKKTGSVTNLERALPITIGDNCWIGANVVVCPGVTIGSGCVIGAGSVVTRDIPADTLAVGNPCKPLRPISNEDSFSSRPDWPNDLF